MCLRKSLRVQSLNFERSVNFFFFLWFLYQYSNVFGLVYMEKLQHNVKHFIFEFQSVTLWYGLVSHYFSLTNEIWKAQHNL